MTDQSELIVDNGGPPQNDKTSKQAHSSQRGGGRYPKEKGFAQSKYNDRQKGDYPYKQKSIKGTSSGIPVNVWSQNDYDGGQHNPKQQPSNNVVIMSPCPQNSIIFGFICFFL